MYEGFEILLETDKKCLLAQGAQRKIWTNQGVVDVFFDFFFLILKNKLLVSCE